MSKFTRRDLWYATIIEPKDLGGRYHLVERRLVPDLNGFSANFICCLKEFQLMLFPGNIDADLPRCPGMNGHEETYEIRKRHHGRRRSNVP